MMPEHLLFWMSPLADAPVDEPGVLCGRHADAMVVPRGWTLDDRRERALRLFRPRAATATADPPIRRTRRRAPVEPQPEQLVIDGTGELPRPVLGEDADTTDVAEIVDVADVAEIVDAPAAEAVASAEAAAAPPAGETAAPWSPAFDHDDDLGGLLEVRSPLLARAFRGTDRPR